MSMQQVRDWYSRRILHNLGFMLEHFDEARGAFQAPSGHEPLAFGGLRPLAFMYKNQLAENRYYADRTVLDKVICAGDGICAAAKPTTQGTLMGEWRAYGLIECADWLRSELGAARVARWCEAVNQHLEIMSRVNNYIATAPNHFLWRVAMFYRAGQVFEQPRWCCFAQMLARQVCRMQTPDGYWEEAQRGHGPSPAYHWKTLHALDLYYRFSGDEEVRPALDRGIEFAVRAAYPDGVPIETFDARQPYLYTFTAGVGAGALSRTATGRRLLELHLQRLDETGIADARHACGFCQTSYAFAVTDFYVDCLRYVEDGPTQPLPQESDHHDTFVLTAADPQRNVGGGLTVRRGPWFAALSAAESDVPRFISNIYITERQSGISLWHEDAGLVAGGGNRGRPAPDGKQGPAHQPIPLANAVVITGWQSVDCAGGLLSAACADTADDAGTSTEATNPHAGCYHPIQRRVELNPAGATLFLEFMHARVRFDVDLATPGRARISYAFESVGAQKILLQLPIPLFQPGRFALEGVAREAGSVSEIKTVACRKQIQLDARGFRVGYVLPDAAAQFTYPLEPMRNWRMQGLNYVPDAVFTPLYCVGLLSQEFRAERAAGTLLDIVVSRKPER